MANDQFGRPLAVGDTVIIKGEVVKVLDDPGYINCTVKLAQHMPPAGTEVTLQCNSAQVEKQGGGDVKQSGAQPPQRTPQPPPAQPQQRTPTPPPRTPPPPQRTPTPPQQQQQRTPTPPQPPRR